MTESDKFIIGLTGNIATGKSVVRKMLEHLGAYGIDADQLSHRIIAKGAPGYELVVNEFGKFVLDSSGQIDRAKLGKLVFSDPEALLKLEAIIHPLVQKAVKHLIKNSQQKVIVIEAIKLLESPLRNILKSIWVTSAQEKTQLSRLVNKKGMTEQDAMQRIEIQNSQQDKVAAADVVIQNEKDFENTWKQVQGSWEKLFPNTQQPESVQVKSTTSTAESQAIDINELTVIKATPKQAEEIAKFINRIDDGENKLTRIDIMAAFGEKAFMLILAKDQIVGVLGWQVENLVAKVDEIWIESGLDISVGIKVGMTNVEEASHELQAEAALVFVSAKIAENKVWEEIGYEIKDPKSLAVSAWQDAAKGPQLENKQLMFKKLRVDRVLKPI